MIARFLEDTAAKKLGVLIDPDKSSDKAIASWIDIADNNAVDFFLIGGSLMADRLCERIRFIKKATSIPVIVFPGNAFQVSKEADAIFFLSLISGRNPEFLIGNHVVAAPFIKKHSLEALPVGYALIDCGKPTSVEYMSNTRPIPYDKIDIAVASAIAGELLGLKFIYLEGGSGAQMHVSSQMISEVKHNISLPLIVGGGIKCADDLRQVYASGADIAVVGTAFEKKPSLIEEFSKIKLSENKKSLIKNNSK